MKELNQKPNLDVILDKALKRQNLSCKEILFLLTLSTENDLRKLFAVARSLRDRNFNRKIFLYGFVYFSTWCRNACTFCGYRSSNSQMPRYRRTEEEIWDAVLRLQESGVHLVDLTMGEDPYYHRKQGFDPLLNLVRQIKRETDLSVMISPGLISKQLLEQFSSAGADWYACYQETYNKSLFRRLRVGQSFQQRLVSKLQAAQVGLLVEEGLLLGVGESLENIASAMQRMQILGAQQVRAMSFIPQPGSPLESLPSPDRQRELITIAVFRLLFPDKLIPASLDIDGISGLADRLASGANVITSLIPPNAGFAGVAQHSKDINEGYRTVAGIMPVIRSLGLEIATIEEYAHWISEQKDMLISVKQGSR
ncbi:MAG: methylornithine synthase PylB [Bacillota bacterium]|nr:methylornithine synthase PylB [Bacillota bacterium]